MYYFILTSTGSFIFVAKEANAAMHAACSHLAIALHFIRQYELDTLRFAIDRILGFETLTDLGTRTLIAEYSFFIVF